MQNDNQDIEIPLYYGKSLELIEVSGNVKMPDLENNACANCPKAVWQISRVFGLHCYCPVKHTNTYEKEQDGDHRLLEAVTQCNQSYLLLIKKALKTKEEIYQEEQ